MTVVFRNTVVSILIFACSSLSAQSSMRGDVQVTSTPDGASVHITGDVKVAGVTPVHFEHLLIGDYRLEVKKYGYESYSSRLLVNPSQPLKVDISLAPKTRFKAAVRSILIPGWGQRYFEKKKRGALYTTLAVVSVAGYFLSDADFDDKFEDYELKLAEYDSLASNGTLSELRALKPKLDEAQNDAYDAENVRRVAIGSVIAVWSINLLDALFFSVPDRTTFSVKGLALNPGTIDGSPAIRLSRNF
ncbi:MAG: PEGA domain-containing protein [bacterium]|nr:PEGA domain-containing protein [bacterium]